MICFKQFVQPRIERSARLEIVLYVGSSNIITSYIHWNIIFLPNVVFEKSKDRQPRTNHSLSASENLFQMNKKWNLFMKLQIQVLFKILSTQCFCSYNNYFPKLFPQFALLKWLRLTLYSIQHTALHTRVNGQFV